jgi:hypothetical protein
MGYKKDIVNYDKAIRPIDRMEMLSVLGKIYAKTAGSSAKISLRGMISEGAPSVKAKLVPLAKTLVSTGLLTRTGTQGRVYRYYWNWRTFGPPSLPMCDWIIEETRKTGLELAKKIHQSRKARGLYSKND